MPPTTIARTCRLLFGLGGATLPVRGSGGVSDASGGSGFVLSGTTAGGPFVPTVGLPAEVIETGPPALASSSSRSANSVSISSEICTEPATQRWADEELLERHLELARVAVAIVRRLGERAHHHGVQLGGHLRDLARAASIVHSSAACSVASSLSRLSGRTPVSSS